MTTFSQNENLIPNKKCENELFFSVLALYLFMYGQFSFCGIIRHNSETSFENDNHEEGFI